MVYSMLNPGKRSEAKLMLSTNDIVIQDQVPVLGVPARHWKQGEKVRLNKGLHMQLSTKSIGVTSTYHAIQDVLAFKKRKRLVPIKLCRLPQ